MGVLSARGRSRARRASIHIVTILAAMAALGFVVPGAASAHAALLHASLLSSEPAAGAVLQAPPARIRLLFSERLEPTMSALSWASAPAGVSPLSAAADPHDPRALVASPGSLPSGRYVIAWRVVSADGHRVDGRLPFTIAGARQDSTAVTLNVETAATPAPPAPSEPTLMHDTRIGRMTRVLRASAITALLAVAGLALMIAVLPISGPRPIRLATVLASLATVLLAVYTVVWSISVAGGDGPAVDAVMTATSTTPGALEVARVALSLLALWALGLARRPALAALFAMVAVLITGASGHPAVTLPYWTIPAKAIHLVAAANWLGGLLWIVSAERHGERYVQGTRHVSSYAFLSVIVVVATGLVQSALFLPSVRALYESTYGRLVLLKVAGFIVLVMFGAYHRRIVPRMETTMARRRLRRSVRAEIAVMIVVAALGGLLATVAPPPR